MVLVWMSRSAGLEGVVPGAEAEKTWTCCIVREKTKKRLCIRVGVILAAITKKPSFAEFGSGELDTNNEKQRALDEVGKSCADSPRAKDRIRRSTLELAAFHSSRRA
jgi:hypothetical protein